MNRFNQPFIVMSVIAILMGMPGFAVAKDKPNIVLVYMDDFCVEHQIRVMIDPVVKLPWKRR